MTHTSHEHDPLNAPTQKVYVLTPGTADTEAKIHALLAIAQQHGVAAESKPYPEGTKVIMSGTIRSISNVSAAVKTREDLNKIFQSELLGGNKD